MSVEALSKRQAEDPATTVIGIGVLIALHDGSSDEPKLLTIEEKGERVATGKIIGRRGIVQETVKLAEIRGDLVVPEPPEDTLVGAMTEVVGPEDLEDVGANFRWVDLSGKEILVPLDSLDGRVGKLEVVIFDGSRDQAFTPLVGEVVNPEWMTGRALLRRHDVRPTSRELVSHALEKGLLPFGMRQYKTGNTIPVFSGGSLTEFHEQRERRPDVTVFGRR